MANAVGAFQFNIAVPEVPKTTYAVSVVSGGTSVNSIAAEAVMQTDTRSVCPEQLDKTVSELVNCVKTAAIEENAFLKIPWDSDDNIRFAVQRIFLTILALAGMAETVEPLLK